MTNEQILKEFRERFPISIDYPPIQEMEVFTQIEIDARIKRARAKNEEIELFLLSLLHQKDLEKEEALAKQKEEIKKNLRNKIRDIEQTNCIEVLKIILDLLK